MEPSTRAVVARDRRVDPAENDARDPQSEFDVHRRQLHLGRGV